MANLLTRRHAMLLAPAGVLALGLAASAAWLSFGRAPGGGIGGPFELVDGNGRIVTERSFRGKWMLVYFGYTHCPDACPTALQDMASALDLLGDKARQVSIVFITVDPERDTPAVMRDYVSSFEVPITALSGTPEQVMRAAQAYRVYVSRGAPREGGYTVDHSSVIYLMDPAGRFAANFTHETPPEAIAEKLRKLV